MAVGGLLRRVKTFVIGESLDLHDRSVFHKVSLAALLAWVGLGADGLSSSCYGPEEAFKALGTHTHLAPFIALASMLTVVVICVSYSQIIELFPTGGGGYLVASKLLSPTAGVVSGCALIIDYILTIAISIAAGGDALFSMMPVEWAPWKLPVEYAAIAGMLVLNLRGVRESVTVMAPVFFLFIATHLFLILAAFFAPRHGLGEVVTSAITDFKSAHAELGTLGLLAVLMRAYSMGAGTYTGIEAVSNGMPILREPRVATGKRTMTYIAFSLATTVGGLILAYLLLDVQHVEGKTLNAVLLERVAGGWGAPGAAFITVALACEAALLVIAAQAGFLDGPRVMASMAVDRWFPSSFATLSERLVNQRGIFLMGLSALALLLLTQGEVSLLVVFYSINVFITFSLSQAGMVRHWWKVRRQDPSWVRKLAINGVGLSVTASILLSLSIVKFHEGGWLTLLITGSLVALAFFIKRAYSRTRALLTRLDGLVRAAEASSLPTGVPEGGPADPKQRTCVILVNGYNGLGVHTTLAVMRTFQGFFQNYIFLSVGAVDSGNFKGAAEIDRLTTHTREQAESYVRLMRRQGFNSEAYTDIGHDIASKITEMAPILAERFPNSVFFGGQLMLPDDTALSRWLHNPVLNTIQRRLRYSGVPFLVMPIRV